MPESTTDPDAPVVSDSPAAPVVEDSKDEYRAKGPIYINGVRAYNEGDRVSANAVKNNKLQKFVEKA